ncbi:hypothetical protein C8034_v010045 [Colletotrichum sidae]|uniref:Uncharacterized protein n=1 Tax=Colletotrichum sidae TaxID=1347389 RepID=A0A4V3I373_9PEZI|nr:hypothetical protein C8034_v010045 [Colletotrichum sidae]
MVHQHHLHTTTTSTPELTETRSGRGFTRRDVMRYRDMRCDAMRCDASHLDSLLPVASSHSTVLHPSRGHSQLVFHLSLPFRQRTSHSPSPRLSSSITRHVDRLTQEPPPTVFASLSAQPCRSTSVPPHTSLPAAPKITGACAIMPLPPSSSCAPSRNAAIRRDT